jgi:hypothetical protein
MNSEILTLCDAATIDSGGKINILGSFDSINSRQEPIVHANCSIVIKVRFATGEEGTHALRVSFTDPEGNAVMPQLELPVIVQLPVGETTATLQVILIIPQLSLPSFGEYSIDLSMGETPLGSMPLFARRIQDAAPPPHQGPH